MVTALEVSLIETWTLYSVGTLAIATRVFCRWRMVGFENFKPDDFLVVPAWMAYTVMTVAAHIVGGTGDTSHLSMEERLAMTSEEREKRSLGSKWFMVGWYTYIVLIWTLKMNMLFLYQRVVTGLSVARFIKPAMGLVVASGVSILILFSTACRPFHKIWQVLPDPGDNCMPQSRIFLITVLTLNLTTDLVIISIPAPVIIPLRTTISRKIGLCLLFGAGIFIMIASILRVVYVLALESGETAAIWSCREDVVAIIVGQATMIRPIFSRKFWSGQYGPGTSGGKSSSGGRRRDDGKPSAEAISFELADGTVGGSGRKKVKSGRKGPYDVTTVLATFQESESTENIINGAEGREGSARGEVGEKSRDEIIVDEEHDNERREEREGMSPSEGPWVIKVSKDVEVESIQVAAEGSKGRISRPGELTEAGNEDGWFNRHGYGQGYAGRA